MKKENIITDKEQEEYKRLTGLEKLGNLMGKELPDRVQQKLEYYRKRLAENMMSSEDESENESEWSPENPRRLISYRNAREMKIHDISSESKGKIIEATKDIPVKVETDADGSRLIEFKLLNKTYKILDPKLENHTYDSGRDHRNFESIRIINKDVVKLRGMEGDNINKWENKELKRYVKAKERNGLHIAKIEEVRDLLSELGEKAKLDKESAQIAMLMYLTGMDGWYWLSMGDNESSGSKDFRSCLLCYYIHCSFSYSEEDDDNSEEGDSYASLLMMSHEEE